MSTIFWWCITAIAIIGTILNARMRREGFYFWMVANVSLLARNLAIREWSQAGLWAVYCFTAVYGLITWTRKERDKA